jgi:enamine deaminase RidA (YjgF/YER057c/UK114 family)
MGVQITGSRQLAGDSIRDKSIATTPSVPEWVGTLDRIGLKVITVRFDGAGGMDFLTFQHRVLEAYQTVFERIDAGKPSQPVRFWAFIPGIHDDLGTGLDRYMAFNAGRYGAFAAHFGRGASDRSIPTASAVGVQGDQFVLHALAAETPGLPVENPRQVSAYHYSRRFGPMPPYFARATLLRGPGYDPLLIVGGTASITGEESRHDGDLQEQAQETFRNLGSVVTAAAGVNPADDAGASELGSLLAAFLDVRVYYTRVEDKRTVAALVQDRFPPSCRVELLQASLCRPELLIEIEGLALLRRHSGEFQLPVASHA